MAICHFFTTLVFLLISTTVQSKSAGRRQTAETLNYLEQYGYYSKPSSSIRHGGEPPAQTLETFSVQNSIKRLQEFFGLPQTGELDHATAELISQPRCGVPDVSDNGLRANFEVRCTQCKFSKSELTYAINLANKISNKMSRGAVEREVGNAFKSWSDVTNIAFRKVNHGDADIRISFHGAEDDFEAPGDDGFTGPVLAHAWFPPDGRLHFDEQEQWTGDPENKDGMSLYAVALHEIGHNLGLRHSRERNSIMWPSIRKEIDELKEDDIKGIQSLYGKPKNPRPSECDIMVAGTDTERNGEYTLMKETCNGMPAWSKPCKGMQNGDEVTNTCYIYQQSSYAHTAWSLSPGFCNNSWMSTCQIFSHSEKYACENHPRRHGGSTGHEQVGWPWEEDRWVNNWWETVEMTCIPKNG